MMSHRLYTSGMVVGGAVMLIVGVAHIFLPTLGYPASVLARLEPAFAYHFYFLATYALCAFFLTQGGFTLWLAARLPSSRGWSRRLP